MARVASERLHICVGGSPHVCTADSGSKQIRTAPVALDDYAISVSDEHGDRRKPRAA